MTTPEILLIITTTSGAVGTLFNNFYSAKRGQIKNIQETVSGLENKAIEIKTQTNGNHSDLMQKIDILLTENNALREKNVTLEKSLIMLSAVSQPAPEERRVRAEDLINKKESNDIH